VATDPDSEMRFAKDLHDLAVRPPGEQAPGAFDWIILDTPPDLAFHTRRALAAAHYVIAPTSPGPYADSGLMQLFETADAMRGLMGTGAEILGCVVTKWQETPTHRDAFSQLYSEQLQPKGIRVFRTRIPFDANIVKDERERFRIPILSKKPAAMKYDELVEEVLAHVDNA
jgi:cellulose biosynthesis protein BcsQ